jgi:hypothetical protein
VIVPLVLASLFLSAASDEAGKKKNFNDIFRRAWYLNDPESLSDELRELPVEERRRLTGLLEQWALGFVTPTEIGEKTVEEFTQERLASAWAKPVMFVMSVLLAEAWREFEPLPWEDGCVEAWKVLHSQKTIVGSGKVLQSTLDWLKSPSMVRKYFGKPEGLHYSNIDQQLDAAVSKIEELLPKVKDILSDKEIERQVQEMAWGTGGLEQNDIDFISHELFYRRKIRAEEDFEEIRVRVQDLHNWVQGEYTTVKADIEFDSLPRLTSREEMLTWISGKISSTEHFLAKAQVGERHLRPDGSYPIWSVPKTFYHAVLDRS